MVSLGTLETGILSQKFLKNPRAFRRLECQWNCQQLAFADSSLTYVEGYALHADVGFPISHAWLLAPDGYAIDPTWDSVGCYFGVPLSTTWVQSVLAARNRMDNLSIFDGNYIEKFSLLKEGLPMNALANLLRSI